MLAAAAPAKLLQSWLTLCVAPVVADSVRPHRWHPTRLPHPWDSPGKNTGVGCHCLLHLNVTEMSNIIELSAWEN